MVKTNVKKNRSESRKAGANSNAMVQENLGKPNSPTRPRVERHDGSVIGELLTSIVQVLMGIPGLFLNNGKLVWVSDGSVRVIRKIEELQGLFALVAEYIVITKAGHKTRPLAGDLCKMILRGHEYLKPVPALVYYSHTPIFDTNMGLVNSGYNADSGIYYHGNTIEPGRDTKHLDSVLNGFAWRALADRSNFVAMLLTGLMPLHFLDGHPGCIINGNQPRVGKTLLAQTAANILEGKNVLSITLSRDDAELEKNLGSIFQHDRVVLADNARMSKGINSPVLERLLTDSKPSTRRLGTSDRIERVNDLLLFITMNSATATQDLRTRCVNVNLEFLGNPEERVFPIPGLLQHVRDNREAILGDLVGMVERWNKTGQKRSDKKTRFGLNAWSEIIGGILDANGFTDFLEESCDGEDEITQKLYDLATGNIEVSKTPKAWLPIAEGLGIFQDELNSPSRRGRETKLGILLSGLVGHVISEVEHEGGTVSVELRVHDFGDRREYVFAVIPAEAKVDKPKAVSKSKAGKLRPKQQTVKARPRQQVVKARPRPKAAKVQPKPKKASSKPKATSGKKSHATHKPGKVSQTGRQRKAA